MVGTETGYEKVIERVVEAQYARAITVAWSQAFLPK
jgi:hypothetical protein